LTSEFVWIVRLATTALEKRGVVLKFLLQYGLWVQLRDGRKAALEHGVEAGQAPEARDERVLGV